MPFHIAIMTQERIQKILIDQQDTLSTLSEGLAYEIQYHKDVLSKDRPLRKATNDEAEETTTERQRLVTNHQKKLIELLKNKPIFISRLRRNQSIVKQKESPCFFISATSSQRELKQLISHVKARLKAPIDADEALFLTETHEVAESLNELASQVNSKRLDVYIPLLTRDKKYGEALIHAIIVSNTNNKLDSLIRIAQNNKLTPSSHAVEKIKEIYTQVISRTSLTDLTGQEILFLKNLQTNIEILIDNQHGPMDETHLMASLQAQTNELITNLDLLTTSFSPGFKQFINDLCKKIKLTPPFKTTETINQTIQSFKQLKSEMKKIEEIPDENTNPLHKKSE